MGYSLLIKGYPKNIEIIDVAIVNHIMNYLTSLKLFDETAHVFDPSKWFWIGKEQVFKILMYVFIFGTRYRFQKVRNDETIIDLFRTIQYMSKNNVSKISAIITFA